MSTRVWVGDEADALVTWNAGALKRGDGAMKIYGLFHDNRESQYLVSRLRASKKARELYVKNVLVCPGFAACVVPETLKRARDDAAKPLGADFGLVKVVQVDGHHYPVIPEAVELKVPVDDKLLAYLRSAKERCPKPAAKKARIGVTMASPFPAKFQSKDELEEVCSVVASDKLMIGANQAAVHQVQLKSDIKHTALYITNDTANSLSLRANAQVTSSTQADVVDLLNEGQKRREGALLWPYKFDEHSLFVHQFGAETEAITGFTEMWESAQKLCVGCDLKLYGHATAEQTVRGSATAQDIINIHKYTRNIPNTHQNITEIYPNL